MSDKEIVEEEGQRLLSKYFDVDKIKRSDDPHAEFLRQANRLKGLGIMRSLKEKYRVGNALFKQLKIRQGRKGKAAKKIMPLRRKIFKDFGFGESRKDVKGALKSVVVRTGIRQVISIYAGKVRAFEKWKDSKVREIKRDRKGRFA